MVKKNDFITNKNIKINDNILVGVEAPRICQYWGSIHHYVTELQLEFSNLSGDELVGLTISMDENDVLHQNYYLEWNNQIDLYIIKIDKNTQQKTLEVVQDIPKKEMMEYINSFKFVLDLDYYLKQN